MSIEMLYACDRDIDERANILPNSQYLNPLDCSVCGILQQTCLLSTHLRRFFDRVLRMIHSDMIDSIRTQAASLLVIISTASVDVLNTRCYFVWSD